MSLEFPRQEYWSGLPCPPPEDRPDSGIEPVSLTFPALAGGFFTTSTTWRVHYIGGQLSLFVVQSLSVAQLSDPMSCREPGFPVLHDILELAQTRGLESVMPSSHLILCHPRLLLPPVFPSIRVFSIIYLSKPMKCTTARVSPRASLTVRWLRVLLAGQETWAHSLVQEDCTCFGAAEKPEHCN